MSIQKKKDIFVGYFVLTFIYFFYSILFYFIYNSVEKIVGLLYVVCMYVAKRMQNLC